MMDAAEKDVKSINELSLDNRNCTYSNSLIKNESSEISYDQQIGKYVVPRVGIEDTRNKDLPRIPSNHERIFVSFTSGAVAGAVAKTVIAPLDRTKIYFQTHPDKRYKLKGAWKFIRLTYTDTGILSLWRGNSATMARIMPYAAIQFSAHDQYKNLLGVSNLSNRTGVTRTNANDGHRKHALHFLAGSLAGVTAASFTYPLDRARAVMAVTNVGEYKNLLDVFKRTLRDEGYRAMYRGFAPTIIGVVPYAGVSFLTYEKLKGMWLEKKRAVDKTDSKTETESTLSPLWRLLFGAIAGLLGQASSYPLDIVRRRMQTARQMGFNGNRYSSIIGTLVYIYRKEGIRRGWYKGISMNFIKGPIAVGLSFTVNDYCKLILGKKLSQTRSSETD